MKEKKQKMSNVWMKVSKDRLELPLAIADTAGELAKICNTSPGCIMSIVSKSKKGIIKNPGFVKIEIEDD